MLPGSITAKYSTFGYGNKRPLDQRHGVDSPPANAYRIRSTFDGRGTLESGWTFGMGYSSYKKVHVPGVNTRAEQIPGPGTYEMKTLVGTNPKKVSLKSRLKPAGDYFSLLGLCH